jgi:eukaryotic-like serine/threonine-protein kinase
MLLLTAEHLHKQNIIHGDLKPSNILVDQLKNGFKILKIIDFGISRTPSYEFEDEAIYGTQAYMPPESF